MAVGVLETDRSVVKIAEEVVSVLREANVPHGELVTYVNHNVGSRVQQPQPGDEIFRAGQPYSPIGGAR